MIVSIELKFTPSNFHYKIVKIGSISGTELLFIILSWSVEQRYIVHYLISISTQCTTFYLYHYTYVLRTVIAYAIIQVFGISTTDQRLLTFHKRLAMTNTL